MQNNHNVKLYDKHTPQLYLIIQYYNWVDSV